MQSSLPAPIPPTVIATETSPPLLAAKESAPAEPATVEHETIYPLTLTLTVENGDTLIEMLTDTGVSYEEANNAVAAVRKAYDVRKLGVGKSLTIELDKNPDMPEKPIIKSVVLPLSATASLEISRTPKHTFEAKTMHTPVSRTLKRASATIDSSLYETGISQGMSPALLAELITAYSYDVDFQRDIRRGDKIDALFERMETDDGTPAGYGNVLYAELTLGSKPIKIYRYVDKDGNTDYYNEKGESVRKALLRTPINGAKITSRFGLRKHPLLGYTKMHRGVDFGAPTGTPIYAAGDGTVDYAGSKGGYGNYLRLKHNNGYATAYGHVSRFAKGMRAGSKVKQGQIVAYVGSTGMSTGPHLHYEVLLKGQQVNPAGVKFKTGTILAGKELAAFRKNVDQVQAQLASVENGKLAMATPSKKNPELP